MVGPIQLLRAAADIQFYLQKPGPSARGWCWCLLHCQNWALQINVAHLRTGDALVRRWMDSRMTENGINRQNGQCEWMSAPEEGMGPWDQLHFNLLFFPQCICISSYHIREFLQLKRIQLPLASSAIHHASSRKGAPGIACSKQRKRTPNVRQISTSFVMTYYSSLQSCNNLSHVFEA